MDSDHGAEDKPPYTDMKQIQKFSHSSPPLKAHEGQGDGDEEEDEEEKRASEGHRPKRERRQNCNSATLCQVCNIQLNSRAQAQIHYRGKTHQRKLRRLAKAVSTGAISQSQVHPLLRSLSLPGRPLQTHLHGQLEHFLPLRVNSSSPLSLFPNFNTLDPVQKAVINHTFGVCPPKKKPIISCNICHLRFNSTTQAEAHYKGHKHARKLKALETQRNQQKRGHSPSTSGRDKEDQDTTKPGERTTSLVSHLRKDITGSRHKQMLDGGQKGAQSQCRVKLKTSSKPACRMKQRMGSRSRVGLNVSRQPFHCKMCQVSVNSETQLKQHLNSRRHKERLAGKSFKVKFTPYNKLQPSAALATKLALQKHLYKALPAGFLTSHLNAAALCTVASGPMTLRLPPSATSMIQSPLISPILFRPAPGPLRAIHAPIIFSPY